MPLTEITAKTIEELEEVKKIIEPEFYRDAREVYVQTMDSFNYLREKQIFD